MQALPDDSEGGGGWGGALPVGRECPGGVCLSMKRVSNYENDTLGRLFFVNFRNIGGVFYTRT